MDKLNEIKIRANFPILKQKVNDEPLIYFDNAATSQIPVCVQEAMQSFERTKRANVHRGVSTLGLLATNEYESARKTVAEFIGAQAQEVIFTSGATDSLNLVANTYGENLQVGDEIVVTVMEHHSNLLPWMYLAKRKKAVLRYIELDQQEKLDLIDAKKKINSKTKIVAFTHVSNVLGEINPAKELIKLAHQVGAKAVVDGAQAVGHFPVNVKNLDADFYIFSAHKMYGPTGVGVLYGKKELLAQMPPYRLGGEMINEVSRSGAIWADVPQKFEAGTPNIIGAIGLKRAIEFIKEIGLNNIQTHEQMLTALALNKLTELPFLTVYGPHSAANHTGVISFNMKNVHPHDLATALDMKGIQTRAGHHCAQVLVKELKTEATVRVSFALYNTQIELEQLIISLKEIEDFFSEFR